MTPASTTREDVERHRLAAPHHPLDRYSDDAGVSTRVGWLRKNDATLRALLDERDATQLSETVAKEAALSLTEYVKMFIGQRDAARARIEELSAEVARMRGLLKRASLFVPPICESWHRQTSAILAGAPRHE